MKFTLSIPVMTRLWASSCRGVGSREYLNGCILPKPGRSPSDRICACGREKKMIDHDYDRAWYACEVCDNE